MQVNYILCGLILNMQLCGAFTVVLDPGHGGKFYGVTSAHKLFIEKDIVLVIAKKIARLLVKHDITVKLTRTQDKEFGASILKDLQNRMKIANNFKGSLFVSLHLNYKHNKRVRGFQVYVPMKKNLDLESYKAAAYMHHAFSQKMDAVYAGSLGNLNVRDRGIRAAKFNVLMLAHTPALLLEMEYATNAQAESALFKPDYQDKIAQVITSGIVAYKQDLDKK